MVKVKGPLFSLSASGTYNKAIEYRSGSGRTIAAGTKAKKPARSAAQTAQAEKFLTAIEAWRGAGDTVRAAWKTASQATGMNGYQLFISEYASQNIQPPSLPIVP